MTIEPDFIYPSSECTGAGNFIPPGPPLVDAALSAEFDEALDNDEEIGELELSDLDDICVIVDDDISVAPTTSGSCAATCSTNSSYQQSLHYFCGDPTLSDYQISSGIESRGSVNDELHSTQTSIQTSIYSAMYSNAPPSIPPPNPAKVTSDCGTLDIDPSFIQNDTPVQQSAASVVSPAALPPDRVIADLDAQMAPEPDKPFKSSTRKRNFRELDETHNNEELGGSRADV